MLCFSLVLPATTAMHWFLQVRYLQEQVEYFNQCSTDKLAAFGQFAKRLHSAIQKRARDFHHKPVGPIGHYLGLSDEKYGR